MLRTLLVVVGIASFACRPESAPPEPAESGQPEVESGPPDTEGGASGGVEPATCDPADCGPQLGMPNQICPDGVTVAGPGDCVPKDGVCGWEIIECPAGEAPVAPE